jgi:hypothetical protein
LVRAVAVEALLAHTDVERLGAEDLLELLLGGLEQRLALVTAQLR